MTGDREIKPGDRAMLEREAIAWLTRVTDEGAADEDLAAFRHWQSQSPAHAEAYAKVSHLWQVMPSAIESLVQDGSVSIPAIPKRDAGPAMSRRFFMGGLATASAAAVGYVVVRPPFDLWPSFSDMTADYRTGTGQQRRVVIAADVSVEMNTQTTIALRPGTPEFDRFELLAGEAVVSPAAGSAKSVQVIAAGGRTTAKGADFVIRCETGAVSVTCLGETVRVESGGRSVTLQRKQQVSYNNGALGSIALVDPVPVTSWRDGYLSFRQEPLVRVIAEVNRYRPGRIVLLDTGLGQGLVTARIRLDQLDDVIALVHDVFGATTRTLPGGIVLLG